MIELITAQIMLVSVSVIALFVAARLMRKQKISLFGQLKALLWGIVGLGITLGILWLMYLVETGKL